MQSDSQNTKLGILYMLISSLSFAVMAIIIKISGNNLPISMQVFVRNVMTALLALYFIKKTGAKFSGRKRNYLYLLAYSTFAFVSLITNFYGIRNLNVADAAVLQKSSPFFVTIFAALFLGDKLDSKGYFAIILAFIGTIFVSKPKFDLSFIPTAAEIISAMSAASAYTVISFLRDKEDSAVIMLCFALFSCLMSLPFAIINFVFPSPSQALSMLLIGASATLAQYSVTKSYSVADPNDVSLYNYSGVVFSAMLGYFLLNEVLDIYSIIGIAVIFAATYMSFKNNLKR